MVETTLLCDQAIFTSTRTPMGEGYRIIAASSGLRPEEKQAITQKSPSHDGLCLHEDTHVDTTHEAPSPPIAVAFYPLANGRFCVALSTFGGAEHTGRGGQRIYTHNAVFEGRALQDCCFNPFHVLRAMIKADLATPQLKPPSVLPKLELAIGTGPAVSPSASMATSMGSNLRQQALSDTLTGESVIVNLDKPWLECGEAFIMGLPGPLRLTHSFSAGIRFSLARRYQINFLHEDKIKLRSRIAGQNIQYLDAAVEDKPFNSPAPWVTFVEQQWQHNDIEQLAQRTGRAYSDCSLAGSARIAGLFDLIDNVTTFDTGDLITSTAARLTNINDTAEGQLAQEVVSSAQRELSHRFTSRPWYEMQRNWPVLVATWRNSTPGYTFATPIIETTLRSLTKHDPLAAFESSLDLAKELPYEASQDSMCKSLIEQILSSFDQWISSQVDFDISRVQRCTAAWRLARPTCPMVQHISQLCQSLTCTEHAKT